MFPSNKRQITQMPTKLSKQSPTIMEMVSCPPPITSSPVHDVHHINNRNNNTKSKTNDITNKSNNVIRNHKHNKGINNKNCTDNSRISDNNADIIRINSNTDNRHDITENGGSISNGETINHINYNTNNSGDDDNNNIVNTISGTNSSISSNHQNSNGIINVKMEHSPRENCERQTVLKWGTASNSSLKSSTSPITTTSPNSNDLYNEKTNLKSNQQITVISPHNDAIHSHQSHESHYKWNDTTDKEMVINSGVQVYQMQHSQENNIDAASVYGSQIAHSPQLSHHSSSSSINHVASPDQNVILTNSPHHHPHMQPSALQPMAPPSKLQQQPTIGSSCEVWSPAYSQYQYLTYHHAPQHASTQ